jgi:hypothetical protein
MIKLVMVTSAGPWRKGQIVLVPDENHWLVSSGYAKVVERPVLIVEPTHRRSKKVNRGSDSAESGSGETVGPDGGSARSVDSGESGVSGDASGGTA